MPNYPSPFESNIPLEKIQQLRAQGTPNNQIIQLLQSEGFNSDQIFDAMNQADMQQNIGQGVVEPSISPQSTENPMQMNPSGYGDTQSNFDNFGSNPNRDLIEETTEAIINEKWKEITGNLQKIISWKENMEAKLNHLEGNFKSLQNNFDKLHQAIIGKIGEYDQNILNVGTEVKAMEKVFQKILPTFTENVSELSRLTEKLKDNR
jgi:DNA-binding transcriptional MerR regulator